MFRTSCPWEILPAGHKSKPCEVWETAFSVREIECFNLAQPFILPKRYLVNDFNSLLWMTILV